MLKMKYFLRVAASAATVAMVVTAPAAKAADSEVDRLLELLVKKHLITAQEAADVRSQAERDVAHEPPASMPQSPPPPAPDAESRPAAPAPKADGVEVRSRAPIRLQGYVQSRFTEAPGTNDPFEIRRARLILTGDLSPAIDYYVQLEAARSPALLDADISITLARVARLTAGQFKIPFSQENLIPDNLTLPIERSLVVNNFVPGRENGSQGRDIGAQLAGKFGSQRGSPFVEYAAGIFDGGGISQPALNRRKAGAGRLVLHPVTGLALAGDYYRGATGIRELRRERGDAEFAYTRGHLLLQGEYLWGYDGPTHRRGWYTMAVYRISPRWEGFFRWDAFDPNRHKPGDTTVTYLTGANWYLSRFVKLQANYGLLDDPARRHLKNLFVSQVQFGF